MIDETAAFGSGISERGLMHHLMRCYSNVPPAFSVGRLNFSVIALQLLTNARLLWRFGSQHLHLDKGWFQFRPSVLSRQTGPDRVSLIQGLEVSGASIQRGLPKKRTTHSNGCALVAGLLTFGAGCVNPAASLWGCNCCCSQIRKERKCDT